MRTRFVRLGRRSAEKRMPDACTVVRPRPKPTTDSETGKVTRPSDEVYSGKCRLQQSLAQSTTKEAAELVVTEQVIRWDTPVGSGPFRIGDVVTITAAELDGQLVGRTYRVEQLFNKSQATAQRCRVVEVL
ncbi:DUF6093 family protein [Paenarthrobacter ilicis]|uniref:DUF6093 family protein n=1 Tax=Paenarthrobacter ilicis TaxID=43665 RepID=UPI0028D7395F|nr:DUF6093 family protein [Paenarthrobacter ilicis]